jgi:hypothetical protein
VSAKAIYRLADKLDIPALKLRAFQHIMSQMSAANVPAEVFSRFSSTFEDVRKVRPFGLISSGCAQQVFVGVGGFCWDFMGAREY